MALNIQGVRLGNIRSNHCSLFHATDRFRELYPIIETAWNPWFAGLSDAEIFGIIDRELYVGEPSNERASYLNFDFLTNTGEQFNGTKTFIICRPGGRVCILYQLRDGTVGSASCSAQTFRDVAAAYVHWFHEQVRKTGPPFFPVNPFDPNEKVPED